MLYKSHGTVKSGVGQNVGKVPISAIEIEGMLYRIHAGGSMKTVLYTIEKVMEIKNQME